MNTEWYYVENGTTVGPASPEDLAEWFRRTKNEPRLVWTKGMSDWADAAAVPEISKLLPSSSTRRSALSHKAHAETALLQKATIVERVRHELMEYLGVSSYLFICFASLLFYKSAILRSEGVEFTAFGLALVKALILGKFILILQATGIGDRNHRGGILLVDILKKSFLFLALLIALNTIEEITLGLFHGREVREVMGEMAGGTPWEAIAVCILLMLILIPYISFRSLSARLGHGVLWKHFTHRGPA